MDSSRTRFLGLLAVGLATCILALPSRGEARPRPGFHGYTFITEYWDNNVFSYSDSDRQIFESGAAAADKFPISSLSDFVTTLAFRGDYEWGVHHRSSWKTRGMIEGTIYARNSDRNALGLGVALQRKVRRSEFNVGIEYTPSYYLRDLYWRPMPERPAGVRYAAARYSRARGSADARLPLSRSLSGIIEMDFTNRNYDFPFNERDSNTYSLATGIEAALSRRLSGQFLGTASLARAQGAQATDPSVEDVSNNAFGARLRVSYRTSRRVTVSESLDYSHQRYTTDNPLDSVHYNRSDDDVTATTRVRLTLENGWQPQVFFTYRGSASTSPAAASDFGQYSRYRAGLQMTRYF